MKRIADPKALQLLLEGTEALAVIEGNGIRVDTEYLDRAITETDYRIVEITESLKKEDIFKTWEKRFKHKANLDSRPQLAEILFDVMKIPYPVTDRTETGRYRTDGAVLQKVKIPFVQEYLKLTHLKKDRETYLGGIRREVVEGLFHPSYNLHLASTFRSSSGADREDARTERDLNFQNLPVRDPARAAMIRQAFIPREGCHLVEVDFSGIEVRVSACVVGTTKIETIDGPQTIKQVTERLDCGEKVHVYGYDQEKGRVAVARVLEGGLTKKKAEVWRLTLDNDEEIYATPDHKFLTRKGEYVSLRDLEKGTSLMPFNRRVRKAPWGTNYSKVYLNNGQSMMAHNLIALDLFGVDIGKSNLVVHHKDGKGTNNSLDNIEIMDRSRHMQIHVKQSWENPKQTGKRFEWHRSEAGREHARQKNAKRAEEWTDKDWEEFGQRISEGIKRKGGRKGKKNSMYGRSQTEETKKRISDAKKGKKTGKTWNKGLTKDDHPSVMKISKSRKGQVSPFKGKKRGPLSAACREKISRTLQGRELSEAAKSKLSENKKAYWKKLRENPPDRECPLCGKKFRSLAPHMSRSHGITPTEYRETYNHKVVSVERIQDQDVYNITVEGLHNYALKSGVIVKNCYNKDPNLIKYIEDPTTDMHRDTAMELFSLAVDQVEKRTTRDWTKNRFVFPEFYGSVYFQCAPHIWEAVVVSEDLIRGADTTIKGWLEKQGIKELGDCNPRGRPRPGTFEFRVKEVEELFWKKRFTVYDQWKKDWFAAYQKNGGFKTLTGFWIGAIGGKQGLLKRNDVNNYPIQGSAFHCLLWTLIQLTKEIRKRKMKTKVVGQIHDSVIADVPAKEIQDYLEMAKRIMTVDLPKAWTWINVPLDTEAEVCPLGGSWHTKAVWEKVGGVWCPKKKK